MYLFILITAFSLLIVKDVYFRHHDVSEKQIYHYGFVEVVVYSVWSVIIAKLFDKLMESESWWSNFAGFTLSIFMLYLYIKLIRPLISRKK